MKKRLTKKQWLRRKRIRQITILGTVVLSGIAVLSCVCLLLGRLLGKNEPGVSPVLRKTYLIEKPEITELFLTPNEYSRPQEVLKEVNGIVVHYTANPGTDAEANRNYFEGLKDSHRTKVSSHFIIGLDGTIVQCIPLDEIAYASNKRNLDTISIECCHKDESGKFTKATYRSLVELLAWLCGEYNLKEENIIRHYDVTGKDCPRYYVKHED
ncbi:MAG: N-acetylmuramoyl-L-alanine amidase family protein, partial [Acetivibrio ethanolgignens]